MVIDLNADLGEGFGIWRIGDDEALLDVVSSANVACGFHAGDPLIIRRTCAAAVDRGVVIGAQVSYRDCPASAAARSRWIRTSSTRTCCTSSAAVDGIARSLGGRVAYVKPHGALYNRACRDVAHAEAVVAAVADYAAGLPHHPRPLPILTLPTSVVHRVAERYRVPTVSECFADRAYTPEGTLVPRRMPGAVRTTRRWSPSAPSAWPGTAWSRPSTARSCGSRRARSASTVTPPTRYGWRRPSGRPWTRPASPWRRSPDRAHDTYPMSSYRRS